MTNTTPTEQKVSNDPVNHPSHYTSHPAKCECGRGIEAIQVTEHMGFNLGNATKYVWRCDLKKDAIEDLKKARWYIDREISKREKESALTVDGAITLNIESYPRLHEEVIGRVAANALKNHGAI